LAEPRYKWPAAVGVFAVESQTLQLVWRGLNPGELEATAAIRHESAATRHRVEYQPGAGGLLLGDLRPATSYEVEVRNGGEIIHRESVTTLSNPPGEPLYRLATMNDLHLGCHWFGPLGWMYEELADGQETSSVKCARAGIAAALEWGAERLVLRGDIVHRGDADEWAALSELVGDLAIPLNVALGNHETKIRPWRVDLATGLEQIGHELPTPVRAVSVPGLEVVVSDTAVDSTDHGMIEHLEEDILDAAGSADGPVALMVHHNFERRRDSMTLPRGIPAGRSRRFLDRLAVAAPASLVSSGHTHRHRRRTHRTIPVVEVGSPRDYPGVWCGYEVYEGGIRQVVRRITEPSCLAWVERTRLSMGGIWGVWSPGRLEDRCFSHPWPAG
jgi:Icc protein